MSVDCDRMMLKADYTNVLISSLEYGEPGALRSHVIAKMQIVTYIVKH